MMPRPIRHHVEFRARITFALLVLVSVIVTGIGTPAWAYWTSTGKADASAVTGTLAAPTGVTVPPEAAPDVAVSWTAGVGGVTPLGYFVTRNNGTVSAACASSPSVLISGPSCTDSAVPDGTYRYIVTAVYRSWTAASSQSALVTVENATAVAFVVEPTNTVAGALIAPAVTVALRTAAGNPFRSSGVAVTLTIGNNPTTGILSGTTTSSTDVNGVATFGDLSIGQPGVGYFLTATSTGLTSDTSAPFTVTAPPILGAAQRFSILSGTAVVNNGVSTVSGDVGVSPGSAITGFPEGSTGGDIHYNDAAAVAAQTARQSAYTELKARPKTTEVDFDLGTRTLLPGVYHSTAALALTGTVTLDGNNDPNAVFIFQSDAAFDTAANSTVLLTRGAVAANVYWVVFGAAGTGANTVLRGTILAQGAIDLGAGTTLIGSALSLVAVTLTAGTVRFTEALAPTITINGGSTAVTKETAPIISGTTSAAESSPVTVKINGQTLQTTVGSGGVWSVTAATLVAGVYKVVARVRDAAGNGSAATQTLTLEVNPTPVNLGAAAGFAVLSSVLTSTPTAAITGDVGVRPGLVTGLTPGEVTGTIYQGTDAPIEAAQSDLLAAIDDASGRAKHTEIVGDLANQTFHMGVHYKFDALALTGTVTLDAEGNPNAVFIFQTDAAFDTAADSTVVLAGDAQADNVYWVAKDAAGTGANTHLAGTLLSRAAINLGAGTVITGRALSLAAVSMASSTITVPTTPAPLGRQAADLESMDGADSSSSAAETPPSLPDQNVAPDSSAETAPSTTAEPTPESAPTTAPQTSSEPVPSTTPPTVPDTPPAATTTSTPPEQTVTVVATTESAPEPESPPGSTTGSSEPTEVRVP